MIRNFVRSLSNLAKTRNIGIIAHIDAGKTTTTERMLYYSGKITRMGEVDHGDTITDYLPQERMRGITIQSAAISFSWGDSGRINLIDTPGHADFSFEVIRSVKVLDGCVTILDAVAGVESQTEKVWTLSGGIPKICFVNKMDREGAGFSRTVKELITRLKTRVVLINIPHFRSDSHNDGDRHLDGVIDIINQKLLRWDPDDPDKIDVRNVTRDHDQIAFEQLVRCRESVIETLGEFDEDLVQYFLEDAGGDYLNVPPEILNKSIREATLKNLVTPVLCGASFRNIGVQPLLDAIVNYLPSPTEIRPPSTNKIDVPTKIDLKKGLIIYNDPNLCVALAFKVITDPIRDLMVFVRVYSGTLRGGNTVLNTSTGKKFRIGELAVMNGGVPEKIHQLQVGDIGVLTGSSIGGNVSTGDTIITHSTKRDGLKSFSADELSLRINPIKIPEPVFTVSVEPKSLGNKDVVGSALQKLVLEDPSLHLSEDEETGEVLLSGMGKLHLEIAEDKLLNSLRVPVELGKISVSFKETLNYPASENVYEDAEGFKFSFVVEPIGKFDTPISDSVATELGTETWYPLGIDNNFLIIEKHNVYDPKLRWDFQLSYSSFVNALISSSIAVFQKGGKISSFPLHSCAVRLKGDWRFPLDMDKPSKILQIARRQITLALHDHPKDAYSILEPIMNLNIRVPAKDIGAVIQDLTSARNATILDIGDDNGSCSDENVILFRDISDSQYLPPDPTLSLTKMGDDFSNLKNIRAVVPLRNMISYNDTLRSLTQGRGEFHMDYYEMWKVASSEVDSITDRN